MSSLFDHVCMLLDTGTSKAVVSRRLSYLIGKWGHEYPEDNEHWIERACETLEGRRCEVKNFLPPEGDDDG